jgi:hypothetical protein
LRQRWSQAGGALAAAALSWVEVKRGGARSCQAAEQGENALVGATWLGMPVRQGGAGLRG